MLLFRLSSLGFVVVVIWVLLLFSFVRQCLSQGWEHINSVKRKGSMLRGSSCLHLCSTGIISACHQTQFFFLDSEDWTGSSCLHSKSQTNSNRADTESWLPMTVSVPQYILPSSSITQNIFPAPYASHFRQKSLSKQGSEASVEQVTVPENWELWAFSVTFFPKHVYLSLTGGSERDHVRDRKQFLPSAQWSVSTQFPVALWFCVCSRVCVLMCVGPLASVQPYV